MPEVPVAYPNDETTAEVIASRLRAAGIAARVDRGLFGTGQVSAHGQMTVFVNEEESARARKLVGTTRRRSVHSVAILRLAVAFALGALLVGIVAIAAAVAGP
jgi:hypothetical protein